MNEEEEKQSVLERTSDLQRQVKQLQAALQELGREHQTLQVMQSRLTQRRWESDREATECIGCKKKFSVSVRKVCVGYVWPHRYVWCMVALVRLALVIMFYQYNYNANIIY